MSESKKRTRKHHPVNPMGGLSLLNRKCEAQIDDTQVRDLIMAYGLALRALESGHGTEQAWSTCACSLNVALVLADQGVIPEALSAIKAAMDALMVIHGIAKNTGEWAAGRHSFVLNCAMGLHDQQIEAASKGQLIYALEQVYARVMSGEVMR
jgi:hypothetical protein